MGDKGNNNLKFLTGTKSDLPQRTTNIPSDKRIKGGGDPVEFTDNKNIGITAAGDRPMYNSKWPMAPGLPPGPDSTSTSASALGGTWVGTTSDNLGMLICIVQ